MKEIDDERVPHFRRRTYAHAVNFLLNEGSLGLGLTCFHGQIRVKRSGSVTGVKDGQNEEIPSSAIEVPEEPCRR